jgi:hypothetical protein
MLHRLIGFGRAAQVTYLCEAHLIPSRVTPSRAALEAPSPALAAAALAGGGSGSLPVKRR